MISGVLTLTDPEVQSDPFPQALSVWMPGMSVTPSSDGACPSASTASCAALAVTRTRRLARFT